MDQISLFGLDEYTQPKPKAKKSRVKKPNMIQLILEFRETMPTQEMHLFTNGEQKSIDVFNQAEMAEAVGVSVLDLVDLLQAGILSFFRKDEATGDHFFSEPAFNGNLQRADILRGEGYTIRIAKDKNKGNPLPWMVVHMGEVRNRYPKASQARQDATTRALGIKAILNDWTYTTATDKWSFMPPSDLWLGV